MKTPLDVLEIYLQPGELYFGEEHTRIRTILGSCVAITLWHPQRHIGGMCHYLLPHRQKPAAGEPLDGRYADEAMRLFVRELEASRTFPGDYEVKVFGGGRMFDEIAQGKRYSSVSERNVDAAHRLIALHGFRLIAEDLGGEGHRNVTLDLWSGDVWMRKTDMPSRARSRRAAR